MDYVFTDFGVDSSSRFPFRARTNRQTNKQTSHVTERPIPRWWLYTASTYHSSVQYSQLGVYVKNPIIFLLFVILISCALTEYVLVDCSVTDVVNLRQFTVFLG